MPDLDGYRTLLGDLITEKLQGARRDQVQNSAIALLDGMADRDSIDLVRDFALPCVLPLNCSWLGIRNDKSLTSFYYSMRHAPSWDKLAAAMTGDGVLGRLVAAGSMSRQEILTFFLFLYAGATATIDMIGNSIYTLLTQPQWLERLHQEPDSLPDVLAELLRLMPPVLHIRRIVTHDVMIADTHIAAGDQLYLAIAAANRDPDVFERPDEIVPGRTGAGHLAFGAGPYCCPAHAMAREDVAVALAALIARYPALQPVEPLSVVEFYGVPYVLTRKNCTSIRWNCGVT